MRIPVRLLLVSLLAAATSLQTFGASFIVPTDRELIDASKAIVIATAVGSYPIRTDDQHIDTVFEFKVEEVIKGTVRTDLILQLVEGGGSIDGHFEIVAEAPAYRVGERALIFVDTNRRGEYRTYGMILGKFNFVRDLHGQRLLLRGADDGEIFGWDAAGNRHAEAMRSEEGFLGYVRAVACGMTVSDSYFASNVQLSTPPRVKATVNGQGFHAADYQQLVTGGGCPTTCGIRWQNIFDFPGGNGSVTFQVLGTQAAVPDPLGGIDHAMGAWNGDPKSNVNLVRGSSGAGVIHLDDADPNDVPPPSVGYTRYGGGGTYTFDGATMIATSSVDIAIKAGFTSSQTLFEEVMTHELGHGLSFRHSGDRTPATSQAIMNSSTSGAFGTSLQAWDVDAVETVYNPSPSGTCTPPSIGTQPADVTITAGQQTTLSVTASGTSPTYQWYVGTAGNTTTTAPSTTNQLTVSPGTTTNYWVRVSGCSTSVDSRTAVVTVNCGPPSTPAPNAFPSTISSGQSSTLSVSPTGSGPFTYQWYVGPSGDTSNQITGATNSSTSVSPAVTTSYWVKVTGQCGTFNSPATTVTVNCTPIPFGGVSAAPSTINVGQSSTLSVSTSGSGPFTFQWYRGSLGDASNPIFAATGSSTVVSPTTNTAYWVHVTAPCGSQDGNVTVFVNAPCTQSSITTHPSFATIAPGGSTTLTVVAAGSAPISYQWYIGTSGNTGNPIPNATNASVTVSPTVTTSYWVRVSNSCNLTGNNSTTAVVTVSANCPAATITTQPASVFAPIGTAATLNVVATVTGTTIHYQWYKGAKGDLSTKVGTDSPTFTTGPVAVTASYWVRLTSACNNLTFTDSNAAIITAIAPPKGRAVRH
jgi:hypothetical protein